MRGTAHLAALAGVSPLVIGLTVVEMGTSVPELAVSLRAALVVQADLTLGNVVGCNIANVLLILGLAAVAAPLLVSARVLQSCPLAIGQVSSVHISLHSKLWTELCGYALVATAVACLPIFSNGRMIARWEGGLFLAYYMAYTTYLMLTATGHSVLPLFSVWRCASSPSR